MRIPKMAFIAMAIALAAALAGARPASSLDGYPARIHYVSNEAPFVVFGVTPTQLDGRAVAITLSFVATDPLAQVNVFPFVRAAPGGLARMNRLITCGPRDPGSWDCEVPAAELLAHLGGADGEFGLRIEAHGELRDRANHSTVIITVPVRRAPSAFSG
ncbi:hypothetical protein [Variovorax sp. OV329]|uniref:hypothetical protein n=1 Tax=Variovorax sp. OV329 TaxID=1882825 RepID=UPI0008ECD517|nr:hypothetical protein [Variovorax sp. OV329]SFM42512.1 hypothetical protein SAMN05444747_105158 [Variovorax sp. OV329]